MFTPFSKRSRKSYTKASTRYRRRGKAYRYPKLSFNQKVRNVMDKTKEMKFINSATSTAVPVAGTSLVVLVSGIGEGVTRILRVGQEINAHSIQIRGTVQQDVDDDAGTIVRILLVKAKHNIEGVLPTVGEIMQADSINSLRAMDNRGDYQVLLDKAIVFQSPRIVTESSIKQFTYYKKWDVPWKLTFDGAGATITDCERGHIFLVLMTNKDATENPSFSIQTRVIFHE